MQKQFLALFKKVKEINENAIISPFGLELLLSLLAAGTKGDTEQELQNILELSSKSAILNHIIKRLATIEEISKNSRFDSINIIAYSSPLVSPIKNYSKNLPSNLNLALKPMLGYKDEVAFIVENILHLKALWQQKFEAVPHKTEFFTLANGETVETLFINQSNVYGKNKTLYLKEAHFHAIQIPLKGDRLCVEIYLPYQKDGLDNFVETLKPSDLVEWGKAFKKVDRMDTYLPKFEVKLNTDFSTALKELEVTKLFQASWDFKPMLSSEYTLLIKKITQNNTFKLNEHGIEASSTSRGYGGITGTRSIDKFILFEATHPFLYLVRDKQTDTILFIGVFETPDKEQDFSLAYYNLAERAKFDKDTESFSFRFSFALIAYYLEIVSKHFDFKNHFIDDYINKIWLLVGLEEGEEFNKLTKELEELECPISFQQMKEKQRVSSDKNHISNAPLQVRSTFYEVNETVHKLSHYLHAQIDFAGILKSTGLYLLNQLNEFLPNWEASTKYRQTEKSLWGEVINRIDFLTIFQNNISQTNLTSEQIRERQQNKILRHLQPRLFDITIRGKLYIGLICLDKMLERENNLPIELKDWLRDLGDFISNETTDKFDSLVLLEFKMFDQTGFFKENQYFSKETLGIFNAKFPDLITILAGLDGILASYKDFKAGYYFGSPFRYMLDFLKTLIQHKIDLPEQQLFEQFPLEGDDILGKSIKLDKKRMKNYYKIIA